MQITVKGKQLDVGEALRGKITEELESLVEKYFSRPVEATVVLSKEKPHLFKADISVHPMRGLLIQGSASADEAHTAFDGAAERIAKQLRRYKRRLSNHKGKGEGEVYPAQQYVLANEGTEHDDELPAEESAPVVVAETADHIPVCTVSGAVMRLDLADAPALMFRNTAHGGLNMVYRRPDGHIGWVDPQGADKTVRA